VMIRKAENPVVIDGKVADEWKSNRGYQINQNRMPGTPPQISGEWKMTYNDEKLFVLVDMKDPTNKLGRLVQMDIEHSGYSKFKAFRTDEFDENYKELGVYTVEDGQLEYLSPSHSVTTFIGIK